MTKKKDEVVEAEVVEESEHMKRFDMVEVGEDAQGTMPATFTPTDMIQHAIKAGAGMETMERLFALQVKHEENEAKKAFFKSFAAFKSEAIEIVKDKSVDFTGNGGRVQYDHATIGNIINTITPYLSNHGLALNWDTKQEGPVATVTCTLTHELGFSQSTSMTAGKDDSGKKNAIQQVASTVTYLQRYTALAITGLATKDQQDDDGKSSEVVEYITEDQWRELDVLISQVTDESFNTDYFCKCYRIDGLDLLPAGKFNAAKKGLNDKIKEQS